MVKLFVLTVIAFVTLVLLAWAVQSQTISDPHFSGLSKKDEKLLRERIVTLSTRMQKRRWSDVYSLFAKDAADAQSKEEFVAENKESTLNPRNYVFIKFQPDNFMVLRDVPGEEIVRVSGCLHLEQTGNRLKYRGALEARRHESGKWLFSYLPTINPNAVAGGPISCS